MKFILNWEFWALIVAIIGLLWSALNFIFGKLVADKITGNDLKHLEVDVKELKSKYEKNLEKNNKALNRIDRKLANLIANQKVQRAICDERHNPTSKKKRKR